MFNRIAAAVFIVGAFVGLADAASHQATDASQVNLDEVATFTRDNLGLRFPLMPKADLDRLVFAIADKHSMDLLGQPTAADAGRVKAEADRQLFAAADRHSMELLEANTEILQAAR